MYLDLSFEYDACFEEFTKNKVLQISHGPIWVSYHTDKGKQFLESKGWWGKLHQRMLCANVLAERLKKDAHNNNLSTSIGGFYWEDIKHTINVENKNKLN